MNSHNITIFGKHPVEAVWQNNKRQCSQLILSKRFIDKPPFDLSIRPTCKITYISNDKWHLYAPNDSVHQGIAVITSPLPRYNIQEFLQQQKQQQKQYSTIIILDQIKDPHNVGAIIRSASAFDIDAIITTKHNSPQETATLAKSASGALENIPMIQANNVAKTMQLLKSHDYWCIGLDAKSKTYVHNLPDYTKVAIVMGGEQKGIRPNVKNNIDIMCSIPQTDHINSLNVSNAAAICMHSLYLKRNNHIINNS